MSFKIAKINLEYNKESDESIIVVKGDIHTMYTLILAAMLSSTDFADSVFKASNAYLEIKELSE